MTLFDDGKPYKIIIEKENGEQMAFNVSGLIVEMENQYTKVAGVGNVSTTRFKTSKEISIRGHIVPYVEPPTKKPSLLKRLFGRLL